MAPVAVVAKREPGGLRHGCELDRAVLVMNAADQIIDMVSVPNGLMTAVGSVFVPAIMLTAAMIRHTTFGITIGDVNAVLVYMVAVHVVKVTIVQIIDMTVVPHRRLAATGAVRVRMTLVRYRLFRHTCWTRPELLDFNVAVCFSGTGCLEIPYNSLLRGNEREISRALAS